MSIATDRIGAAGAWSALTRLRGGAAGAAIHVFAIRIGAAGFAYVGQVLMARLMGGTEYGVFAAIWVWIAILGHSATLGLSQGACRFIPADQARGDLAAVRAYLVGGVGMTFLQRDSITLVPIKTGLGARLGVNVGYLKLTPSATWNPF